MTERQKLLADIEAFIEKAGLAASKFGVLTMNDPAFVGRLRSGGDVRTETAAKVRTFIREHQNSATPKRRAESRVA
jgi:hypothetical protein